MPNNEQEGQDVVSSLPQEDIDKITNAIEEEVVWWHGVFDFAINLALGTPKISEVAAYHWMKLQVKKGDKEQIRKVEEALAGMGVDEHQLARFQWSFFAHIGLRECSHKGCEDKVKYFTYTKEYTKRSKPRRGFWWATFYCSVHAKSVKGRLWKVGMPIEYYKE